ncbi:MAG: hypothetical protein KAU21_17590, partial [Gammaproteobacteria bacterium]|nr:hypothetical protein [Gammaproteobacteria bacterium]
GLNYNYHQLYSESVQYSNTSEVSSGYASVYTYSGANTDNVANEFLFGVVSIDRYQGTTTPETSSHNFFSYGAVFHPTIDCHVHRHWRKRCVM